MKILRNILPVVGVLFFAVICFVVGNVWVKNAWDWPAGSTRHQAYDFFLQAHRYETIAALIIYLALVVFAFQKEWRGALRGIFRIDNENNSFLIRLASVVVLAVIYGVWVR